MFQEIRRASLQRWPFYIIHKEYFWPRPPLNNILTHKRDGSKKLLTGSMGSNTWMVVFYGTSRIFHSSKGPV